MAWHNYRTNHFGLGTLCKVLIDNNKSLIRREFISGATTVSGKTNNYNEEEVRKFFNNEVYWLKKLDGKWLPELVEINYEEQYIVQKFYRNSLLYDKHRLLELMPDINDQIIKLYKFFKKMNVYKCNGSLSNMTVNNNQLIAFRKPAGVPVQADKTGDKSLLDLAEIYGKSPMKLIHRLDRPASGIVLIAQNKQHSSRHRRTLLGLTALI